MTRQRSLAPLVMVLALPAAAALAAPEEPVGPLAVAAEVEPAPAAGLALPGGALEFAELPNFHRIDQRLFRGGQPATGGMAALKTAGVRTVLNLRYEERQSREEQAAAEAEGLRYFSIPMYGLLKPTQAQMKRVFEILDAPENQPVFVHCERGSDRTGVVVACYRVARNGWTPLEAIREAMGLGMLKIEYAKRRFVHDFAAAPRDKVAS
jgi:tyrosine-protein phosphatase SIW14